MNHRHDWVRATRLHVLVMLLAIAIGGWLLPVAATDSPPPNTAPAPLTITAVLDGGGHALTSTGPANTGLNDSLRVRLGPVDQLDTLPTFDASSYVLFLNGREVKGLEVPTYDRADHSLLFKLTRTSANSDFWKDILGSPTASSVPVSVALGRALAPGATPQVTVTGSDTLTSFKFQVISGVQLSVAVFAIILVVALVWGHARNATTLRDNLLPQVQPSRQPYSLGRWQMAFWFTLIFSAFVFLFLLLWDANTISAQALGLMGISGATALAAVVVDVEKNSPADACNLGLQALGLNSYEDVVRVRQEIVSRQAELKTLVAGARYTQLSSEILDRQLTLQTYDDKIRPFVTQGWFKDLTTDLNGTALHRLQVFCWTWALGIVFVIGVYRGLAMQDFSPTLLALMGISSAGYVGFKIPEVNN
jgi:hypothetical protein